MLLIIQSSKGTFRLSQNAHNWLQYGYNKNRKKIIVAKSTFRARIDDYQITVLQIIILNFAKEVLEKKSESNDNLKSSMATKNQVFFLLSQTSEAIKKNSKMKTIFRTVFYLRSNYQNKEGLSPVMIRIYLNNERLPIGSAGVAVNPKQWDNDKNRLKGRTTEVLQLNQQLDNIQAGLQAIFRRLELSEELGLELIKSEYLGKKEQTDTILSLFEKHNNDMRSQVGISKTSATLQKYENCKRHFTNFLKSKYGRSDLKLCEVTPIVIHDFQIFLLSVQKCMPNTATKILKFLKTILLFGRKNGFLTHDPFCEIRFHLEPVDRGFLTDNEIKAIIQKEMVTPRLDLVRDIFIFSCFTGLAYIDVANLTEENMVEMNGRQWIMTKRQKTKIATNIVLLDIPKMIIEKYASVRRNGKLLPILCNQKMNSYLKEIADICHINKNLTYHLARHTFATMSLSKGVPIESVSKMLGHSNIKTTQIYARITNKKLEADMMMLSDKLSVFETEAEKVIEKRKLKEEVGLRRLAKNNKRINISINP